ncbi:PASTA domain-containing protein [Schaalia sp. ZJ405]|uniref:PASTA domain-containing protein n=1 Tax=Schaalia sp. ZJ405 TaxID=2709403 RepID=UPI0013EDD6F0|nr:PASTA domain-containing protein [Schaalia sp. ZJ405]QPK80473.1 PASTA domain-containing protein [Schaalia sp. ZJ405]
MPTCPQCGSLHRPNVDRCPVCGLSFGQIPASPVQPPQHYGPGQFGAPHPGEKVAPGPTDPIPHDVGTPLTGFPPNSTPAPPPPDAQTSDVLAAEPGNHALTPPDGQTPAPDPSQGTPNDGPKQTPTLLRRHRKALQKPAAAPDDDPKATLRRSLRKTGVVAIALFSFAALAAAFIGGWFVQSLIQTHAQGPVDSAAASRPDESAQSGGAVLDNQMPDVRGLPLNDAKQILADMDISLADVTVESKQWGGQPGLVIAQDPVMGEARRSKITLTVSEQAKMPRVIGSAKKEALETLRAFGVEPTVVEKYAMGSPTGTVIQASVKEGDPLPASVELTLAQAGSSIFLSQLNTVDSSCSRGAESVNGTEYANSLRCSPGRSEEGYTYGWLLNRKAMYLEGIVGVSDTDDTDSRVTVTVVGDGKQLASVTAAYATPVPLGVDVTGVLRLEVHVIGEDGSAVLADVRVKGSTDEIATLQGEQ